MDVSGTQAVSAVQKPEDSLLVLKVNQRISAEVLQVAGQEVTLSVNGLKIVGRLTSADQSAELVERKVAHFIVKDTTESTVGLQLLRPGLTEGKPALQAAQDLAQRLLSELGIPIDRETALIARSLIRNGLAVNEQSIEEIKQALAGLSNLSEEDANLAGWIKAQGLPLSPGTLSLAMANRDGTGLTATLMELNNRLIDLVKNNNLPLAVRNLASTALANFSELFFNPGSSQAEINQAVMNFVRWMGHTIERDLQEQLEQSADRSASSLNDGMQALLQLRRELTKNGNQDWTIRDIDRFLETVRWNQFINTQPEDVATRGQWLSLKLPLQGNTHLPGNMSDLQESNLRISCQSEGKKIKANPGYTRLVIEMDMKQGQKLTIDLSIAQKQIGAQIIASDQSLADLAESEVEPFRNRIEELGYAMHDPQFSVGQVTRENDQFENLNFHGTLTSIDLDA